MNLKYIDTTKLYKNFLASTSSSKPNNIATKTFRLFSHNNQSAPFTPSKGLEHTFYKGMGL